MPDKNQVVEAIQELQSDAFRYHRFGRDPEEFLREIHRMGDERLREYLERSKPFLTKRIEGVRQISPVVFLRNVLVSRVIEGRQVTPDEVEKIKKRIEDKDASYFEEFGLSDEIAAQKERKVGAFVNWNLFRILFYIDHVFRVDRVRENLRLIGDFLRAELGLNGFDYFPAGFNFNQNFGTDWCWIAVYPSDRASHQDAYQAFLGIHHDHIEYGVVAGGRTGDAKRDVDTVQPDQFQIDKALEAIRLRLPKLLELNRNMIKAAPGEPAPRENVRHPLNVILYGPPGTGKTYSVQSRALSIIEGSVVGLAPEEISKRFRRYLKEGRIEFVTFHSSYSYEEFVEGFRYDPDEKIPVLKDGVFLNLVARAANPRQPESKTREGATIWKVSLGASHEQYVYERCMKNDEIAIGWYDQTDLSGMDREAIRELFAQDDREDETTNVRTVNYFINEMREGDYVAVLGDQRTIKAIGVVTGSYRFKGREYKDYGHTRPVRWLDRRKHDIYELNDFRYLTLPTVYPLSRIPLQDFLELLPRTQAKPLPYVLIIDEINRGNIARIFGELITLLEADKRRGAANELTVRLAYSQRPFSVPANLHVIGTMNTADRSIALLDVALRRRFLFEEMMPDVSVIRDSLSGAIEGEEGIDLTADQIELVCDCFEKLNRGVTVLLDRDHQIGHAYFMHIRSMSDLRDNLYRQVFPLLQEYFYNDHGRLAKLLGTAQPEQKRGFVRTLESGYSDALSGEEADGVEMPWEFHNYRVTEIEEVLRRTFLLES